MFGRGLLDEQKSYFFKYELKETQPGTYLNAFYTLISNLKFKKTTDLNFPLTINFPTKNSEKIKMLLQIKKTININCYPH